MRPGGIGGAISQILADYPPRVATPDETMLEHVRSALSRNLRGPQLCRPHSRLMSVAGGGPSLADTWKDLKGTIVTANAGLTALLDKGVTPWACGLLDAREHIADLIEPHPDVFYFVASTCHPRVFDRIANCKVVLWHPSGCPGIADVVPPGQHMIAGASTMGLRWMNLGFYMGFRRFVLHGMDSSYRGRATHAYPDYRDGRGGDDGPGSIEIDGFRTDPNFLEQVRDFVAMRELFTHGDDATEIQLKGTGLLQHTVRKRADLIANWPRRSASKRLNVALVATGDYLGRGAEYVAKLKDGIAKHFSGAYRFHVITEGPASWWAKMQLFEPGRFPAGERVVFFDLDTVIRGDLTDLFAYDGPFAGLRDVWQPGQMGSGIMTWTAGEADHVWKNWVLAGRPTDDPRGDQAWITDHMPMAMRLQDILPGQLVSWKAHCGGDAASIPDGARVVYFHGQPRPHETSIW